MKHYLATALFLFVFALSSSAYAPLSVAYAGYDLGARFSFQEHYLAGRDLGQSSSLSSALVVWDKSQPLISLSYATVENSPESAAVLPLIKNRFDAAASLRIAQNWRFKIAGTGLLQENNERFGAQGAYLAWRDNKKAFKGFEAGMETDSQKRSLLFGYGRFHALPVSDLLVGFSQERVRSGLSDRLGGALISNISENYSAVLGLTKNLDDGAFTKLYGFAKNAPLDGGDSLSFAAVFRQKPESSYFLGLLAFGGRSFNKYANEGIFEAMFSGTLSGTRIVGNRNFDRIGLSEAYRTQDYAKLVASLSAGTVKVHGTSLTFDSEEVSYTFGDAGIVKSFFASLGRSGETNLTYDPKKHRLLEDYQQYARVGCGGTVPFKNSAIHFGLTNSYSLNQSSWAGMSASLTFSF